MPTTLATLKADVLTIVKRPDLVTDIDLHTKNAILKLHQIDYWKQDLQEFAITFATASPTYSLEIRNLVPRFRKMKYMNTIDQTTGEVIRPLTSIEVTNYLDQYGYKQDYTFYEAGDLIQIRTSDSPQYFNMGIYLVPDVTLLQASSWIADMYPAAIVHEACRTLYKSIGQDEQSSAQNELLKEDMVALRAIGIPTIGE